MADGVRRIDPFSESWLAVQAWCRRQMEASHRALEARGTSHEDTCYERGRAAAFREILSLTERQENSDWRGGE